jgi:hypothetical protein
MRLAILVIMLPFLIPIVLVILFIIKLVLKGKNEGWRGTVIDKIYKERRDDDNRMEHFYTLKIKTDDAKERNIAVSPIFYEECKIGDTIEKPKGKLYPVKVG